MDKNKSIEHVGPLDPSLPTSPFLASGPEPGDQLPVNRVAGPGCYYNGKAYPTGATICLNGNQYRCNEGSWINLEETCSSPLQVFPTQVTLTSSTPAAPVSVHVWEGDSPLIDAQSRDPEVAQVEPFNANSPAFFTVLRTGNGNTTVKFSLSAQPENFVRIVVECKD